MRLLCTPDVIELIARQVRKGASIKRAGPEAGYSWNTIKVWMRRGRHAEVDDDGNAIRAEDAPFVDFVNEMDRAKATWAATAERNISRAGRTDWKASAYLLERRHAAEYRLAPLPRAEPNIGNTDPGGGEGGGESTVKILVYPVPVPIGADPRTLRLPTGHALEHVDTEGEGGEP